MSYTYVNLNIIGPINPGSSIALFILPSSDLPEPGQSIDSVVAYILDNGNPLQIGDILPQTVKYVDFDETLSAKFTYSIIGNQFCFKLTGTSKYLTISNTDVLSSTLTPTNITLTTTNNIPVNKLYGGVVYKMGNLNILFAPLNINNLNLFVNGGLVTPSDEGLVFWTNNPLTHPPLVLKGICADNSSFGWLTSNDSGCWFTDLKEAQDNYFYNYAKTNEVCTNGNFGLCPVGLPVGSLCAFDSKVKITDLISPYTCEPKTSSSFWGKYKIIIIISIVVIVLIILIIIIVLIIKNKNKNKNVNKNVNNRY